MDYMRLQLIMLILRDINLLELLLEQVLESLAVLVESSNTLVELVVGHLVTLELLGKLLLVVNKGYLLDRVLLGSLRLELLGNGLVGVHELLQELGGDGEVITSGQSLDFTNVSEGGTHDNGVVSVLLVVVEDLLDRLDTGVSLTNKAVSLVGVVLLEPVHCDTVRKTHGQ